MTVMQAAAAGEGAGPGPGSEQEAQRAQAEAKVKHIGSNTMGMVLDLLCFCVQHHGYRSERLTGVHGVLPVDSLACAGSVKLMTPVMLSHTAHALLLWTVPWLLSSHASCWVLPFTTTAMSQRTTSW